MNLLNVNSELFEFETELDRFANEDTGTCSECGSDLELYKHAEHCSKCEPEFELDELDTDTDDLDSEGEIKRGKRRFRPRVKKPLRPKRRPLRPSGTLRPKPKPRPPKRPTRPIVIRPGRPRRRRPVVIREPAAPCVCPVHGTEFVRWVQSSLNHILGLRLRINGVMNRATRNALRDFQNREGLTIDGIAGPETEQALINAKAKQQEISDINGLEELTAIELDDLDDKIIRDELLGSEKVASLCTQTLGGAPPKGLFTGSMRDGTRWYTPIRGDNRWKLSRIVLQRIFAVHDVSRAPNGREITAMSKAIKNDPCNAHIVGRMFLPRFQSDRFTLGGAYYGSIHIRAKF